jgi:tricorn protease-like protein
MSDSIRTLAAGLAATVALAGAASASASASTAATTTATATTAADDHLPNPGMLRWPDISGDSIVFTYANDLWIVDRTGGTARPLASPDGAESRPRFSPDGRTIAFMGNYDGGNDLYTIPAAGGLPTRVTHHPSRETLNDWHGDDRLLFSSSQQSGITRAPMLFSVGAAGGLPESLPVPYGDAGAVSPDGEWLAYTPNNRDGRTWKRYRGGMASDVWLFNLQTMESRRVTDWEGTDTQPMWSPDGKRVLYYLSDAGPAHRLNIWKYDVTSGNRTQVTDFDDYDVKWPAMGPGPRGRGEIIFQHASRLKAVDLSNGRIRTIEIEIPGARPTLRPQRVDASAFITDWGIAPRGVRALAEARGDIWTLPAENGSPRNLTATSGVAERDPAWSPDGRWVAYFADTTGEYELYVRQSDGAGEPRQLTSGSSTFYSNPQWSPDGTMIAFADKGGQYHLVDLGTDEHRVFHDDPWGGQAPLSWSHDSGWIAFAAATEESPTSRVHLYDVAADTVHQVTHGMFGDSNPVFDRTGDWLYFTSARNFSPTYSNLDTTFIYDDAGVMLAVPLREDVELPWQPESDEVTWADDADDDAKPAEPGDADDADDAAPPAGGDGADDDAPAAGMDAIVGRWEGTLKGLSAINPELDDMPFTMTLAMEGGRLVGSSEAMGESSDFNRVSFDPATGRFEGRASEDGVTSVMRGTLDGRTMAGEWELVELGIGGTWEAKKTADGTMQIVWDSPATTPSIAFAMPGEDEAAPAGDPVADERSPFAVLRRTAVQTRVREEIRRRAAEMLAAGEITGSWEGELRGLSSMGLPPEMDAVAFTMSIARDGDDLNVSMMVMGEAQDFDEASFNEATGAFTATGTDEDGTSVLRGTLTGNRLEGTWSVVEMEAGGSWSATRLGGGPDASGDDAAADDAGDDAGDGDAKKTLAIDLEGFEGRAIMLPVAPGNFGNLAVNDRNQLLYVRGGGPGTGIKLFDLAGGGRAEQSVQPGVGGFILSPDGTKLIFPAGRGGNIRPAAAGGAPKPVVTRGMIARIQPRAEWAQILRDAWRIQRDFFYVANMHGVDWEAVYEQYAAMLPDAVVREDVSFIIAEMISELNVGHAYYSGGDTESATVRNVGLLGVDWELHDGAYRIARIIEGADWDVDARNPLHMQDTGIREGHYVLAVNGVPIDVELDPWAAFLETAGREITLTVSERPVMDDDAMHVVVRPIGSEGNLRYRDWIESKRATVAAATDDQVGYIYVPNTGRNGQNDLFRQFYGQIGKKALIIDERWNGGGQIPTRFIELLNRPATNFWARRDSIDWKWPPDSFQGPACMLINGLAGSGGDMFPWLFREAGLGKLIGTRTWGGLVGISGNPGLIDGGYTAVPTFGFYETDGTWGIEGHGVDPDIEVIDDPAKMVDGGDPQLEAAIALMLEEIETFDYPVRNRPEAPDRSGMGIREDDK